MSKILTLIIALFLVSCSDNPDKMLTHLNGYWEISKAEMNDGFEKDYNFNASIDYIMVNDSLKGFRKNSRQILTVASPHRKTPKPLKLK